MEIKNKKAKAFLLIYLILIFIFMSLWSYKTPLVTDDLFFSNNHIIGPSINDYFESNGRIFGQMFTRIILSKGILFSSICTGLAFTVLLLIIFKITNSYKNNSLYIERIILITVSIFLFVPSFASIFIWRAGVGNYLITAILELLFIMVVINSKNNTLYVILAIALGFCAGLGNENTSGGILLICILFLIKSHIQNKKISPKLLIGTLSLIVGYVILMLSPGSRKRAELNDYAYLHQNLVKRLIEGLGKQATYLNMEFWPIVFLAFTISVIVVSVIFWKKNPLFWNGLIFIAGGIASGIVLIASPEGMDVGRPYFGPTILLLIGIMLLIPLKINDEYIKAFYISGILIFALICSFNLIIGIQNARSFNNQLSMRYSHIKRSKNEVVKLEPIERDNVYNKYSLSSIYWEVTNNDSAFPNNQYYEYFRKKVILKK